MKNKIIAYGKYSNSQNGVVVSVYGVAQCICSGGQDTIQQNQSS